jgi:hypothetical protein
VWIGGLPGLVWFVLVYFSQFFNLTFPGFVLFLIDGNFTPTFFVVNDQTPTRITQTRYARIMKA